MSVFKDADPNSKEWKNRQRTMVFSSRGISSNFRYLVKDIISLVPNTKVESKLERKNTRDIINDLCYERSCNNYMFFDCHKHVDLFLWLAKSPNGPSIKFQVSNIHTTQELKLTGNCLKYSRPLLSFDAMFDSEPHLRLAKEMFTQMFGTPKNHPKSKPFIDHVISFNILDGKVNFRVYQVVNQEETMFTEKDDVEKLVLIEIGPRMTLQPIKYFAESLGGQALWQNPKFITPAKMRGKSMNEFLKSRDKTMIKKRDKKRLLKEGQDEDGYIESAFM